MRRPALLLGVVVGALAVAAAGCGGGSTAAPAVTGTITFDGVWTGQEAQHFQAVIKAFEQQSPGIKVNYKPVGDNLPTVLATAVAGGRPPDMADIAQPGLVKQFVGKGALKPITYAKPALSANFAASWLQLGTFDGKLYGLVFKASNKSTVWYNVAAFKNAGVSPPTTWSRLLGAATTIRNSGTPPYAIGGADGWTLTDLFENIYLRQAGAAKYAQLSAHTIKWTDPSVTTALKTMRQVIGVSGRRASSSTYPISSRARSARPSAKVEFPGRDWIFVLVIGLLVVPLQMALIPTFTLYNHLGLYDTVLGIILFHTAFGLPFAIFLLRNFLAGIPKDILESARIDGASELQIFVRLILPLGLPAIASVATFQFLWTWNDLIVALKFGQTVEPITVAIFSNLRQFGANIALIAPASFISLIVPLAVFFAFQRYFVQGLLAGSVK